MGWIPALLADVLVILGVLVMTVGVYGMIRMPDIYNRLHAAGKMVFLGVITLLASAALTGDALILLRCVLISAFLLVTTPVTAHVIAKAAYLKGERTGAMAPARHPVSELPDDA